MPKKEIMFGTLYAAAIVLITILLFYNSSLKSQIVDLNVEFADFKIKSNTQISELEKKYVDLNKELNEKNTQIFEQVKAINKLEEQLQLKSKSLESAESENQQLAQKIQETKRNIGNFQADINYSINWFKSNAKLNDSEYTQKYSVKNNLISNCVDTKDDNICKIKVICLYFVNFQYTNLRYSLDAYLLNKTDRLQSINEFINHIAGDCEDFSLLYKAEINELLDYCKSRKTISTEFEYSIPAPANFEHFVTYRQSWFVNGAESYFLKDFHYPIVICGTFPDPVSNTSGHCVVAFTKEKISPDMLDLNEFLNQAPIVEPQNGIYLGRINNVTSNIYVKDESIDFYNPKTGYISMIISDDDLWQYNAAKKQWENYNYFYEELNKAKGDFSQII